MLNTKKENFLMFINEKAYKKNGISCTGDELYPPQKSPLQPAYSCLQLVALYIYNPCHPLGVEKNTENKNKQ